MWLFRVPDYEGEEEAEEKKNSAGAAAAVPIYTHDEWIRNETVYFFIGEGKMLYSAFMLITVAQSNLPQDSLALPSWQGI